MIKILYVISTLANTGPVNQLYNLVKNIDKNKFKIEILTLSKEGTNSRIKEFTNIDIEIHSINIPHKKIHFYKKPFLYSINHILPNIVHSHGIRADFFNSLLSGSKKDIIKFTTVHNIPHEDYPDEYGVLLGMIMARNHLRYIKKIDYPVACSKSVKEMLREKHRIDTYAICNSADEEKFSCSENFSKGIYREKLNLGKDKIIYICVGGLIKRKNVEYLVNAFNNLNENYQLLVLGDGHLKHKLKKKSSNNIFFLGRQDNVRDYLLASDVFVSSSLSEGMPTAVLEAMACGLPVLLSDIPVHREIIDKNPFIGDLFSLSDRDDLINKIKAYSSKDIIEEKSKASVDTFNKYFTSKRMTEEYTKLYENAIKEENSA